MKLDRTERHWLIGLLTAAALGGAGLIAGSRLVAELMADRVVRIITQDPYRENMYEAISSFQRASVQNIIETDLRATDPSILRRPLGSPRKFPGFHSLMFRTAQLDPLPTPFEQPVSLKTTIGPQARIPLTIDLPILIGAMGYGVGLSKDARLAIARAANEVGTAANTGEGPVLPEERAIADKLIVQYHRGNWMDLKSLENADMIEIHIGQGASASGGGRLAPERLTPQLKRELGLAPDEEAHTGSTFPELRSGEGLKVIVDRARCIGEGVPVIVKLAASHRLERDLDICVEAGVDGVAIDGAQAGTVGSPPITEDDFGLPTIYAVVRARRHLDQIDPDRRVSLIVGGGLYTPGEFLKCLALGADAVYVASVILFSLMAGQQQKTTPAEPPTEAIMYMGRQKSRFDIRHGTNNVIRFLRACREEITYGVRNLGKTDVHDVNLDDLCALDKEMAEITGAEPAWLASRHN